MFTMSAASTAVTNVPRRGCTATRFSSASRLTASRSGVRPISISRISSSSRRTVPGPSRRVTMRSRRSTYARSATRAGGLVGSAARGVLQRLREERRDVHHAEVVAALADAVVEHDGTERAGDGQRVGARLGRLPRALLVDLAAALLHPHVGAAGAAAERALAASLHLDRLAHRGHQLA